MRSSLCTGTLRHARHRPRRHDFTYDAWHVLLDLDELPALDASVVGFGWNRPAPAALHDVDHLGPVDLPLRTKLARWLDGQGVALPDGPVLLWTQLRVLGYAFNPVSWWFCHDPDGRLAMVVAEVNNTFGDTHGYVLDDLDRRGHDVVAAATKVFHVSPFLPVDPLRYAFRFRPPSLDAAVDERVVAHMDVADADGHLFDATLGERRAPLTTGSLWRALGAMPWVTLRTTAGIHHQAARLWAKGVPFHRRPEPPDAGLDAVARPPTARAGGTEHIVAHDPARSST